MIWLNLRTPEAGIDKLDGHVGIVGSRQFQREASALLGSQILPGNAVTDYQNGVEFFPAMLKDIRSAKVSINLESYIFRDSRIGRRFVDALIER
ncbi:MAG TPA: cardiolipin synthase B, partial [Oleiagrimonas sp.]|nr:cardiolipin synthase B [Oleiagrimonas sp.]